MYMSYMRWTMNMLMINKNVVIFAFEMYWKHKLRVYRLHIVWYYWSREISVLGLDEVFVLITLPSEYRSIGYWSWLPQMTKEMRLYNEDNIRSLQSLLIIYCIELCRRGLNGWRHSVESSIRICPTTCRAALLALLHIRLISTSAELLVPSTLLLPWMSIGFSSGC